MEIDAQAFGLERDQSVEQDFPVLIAGEIVIGEEEPIDAERRVGAYDGFEVVGRAEAALAPLDVDDGAERAFERTAAPEVEARMHRQISWR